MRCAYRECDSIQKTFSSLAFFVLPNDHRRSIWADHSGNPDINNANTKRVFCELHFEEHDKKRQFNRTILRRDAIPIKFQSNDSPDVNEKLLVEEVVDEPGDLTDSTSSITTTRTTIVDSTPTLIIESLRSNG